MPSKGAPSWGKGPETGFDAAAFTPDKLAPPGAAPPLIPGFMPVGEEGAILEPNAPTQNPDFFPNAKTEGEPAPSDVPFKPAMFRKGSKPQELECVVDVSSKGFEAVLKMGPILVPTVPPAPTLNANPVGDGRPSGDAPKPGAIKTPDSLPNLGVAAEDIKVPDSATPPTVDAKPYTVKRPDPKQSLHPATPLDPASEAKPIAKPFISTGERKKVPDGEEKLVEVTGNWRKGPDGPLRPGPDTIGPAEGGFILDDVSGMKIEDVPMDGDDRLLGKIPVDRPTDPARAVTDEVKEVDASVIPKPRIDPSVKAELDEDTPNVDEAKPAREKKADPVKAEDAPLKPARVKKGDVLEVKGAERDEAKVGKTEFKESEIVAKPVIKEDPTLLQGVRSDRPRNVDPAAKPLDSLNGVQTDSILKQVAERLESLAASHAHRKVTIQLDPESFGSITLVVRQSGSDVNAEVYASHDSVRAALEVNRAQLAANLDQRGIQLGTMTVGHELPQDSGRQEQAMREAAKQHGHFFAGKPDTSSLSLEAMRSFARKPSGVDLWI